MKPIRTWILVADGARARIFKRNGKLAALKPALKYDFAASHAPTRAHDSDRPGRSRGPGGGGHGKTPRVDAHDYEKQMFARDLAQVVNDAAGRRVFDELIVVAPPKTLGELRSDLSAQARAMIKAELGKDLTHVPIHDLPTHLEKIV